MLTGRSDKPTGFNPSKPMASDHPSLAAIAGAVTKARNNLPPAIVLPDKIVHNSGRVIPGQFAGVMGQARDPWFIEASAFEPKAYGAFPEYEFDHQERPTVFKRKAFTIPDLSLPQGVDIDRFNSRLDVLKHLDAQRKQTARRAVGRSTGSVPTR
jgi:hypothetical protein